MCVWIAEVRAVLSVMEDTQEGSCECQTVRYGDKQGARREMGERRTEGVRADEHTVLRREVDERVCARERELALARLRLPSI